MRVTGWRRFWNSSDFEELPAREVSRAAVRGASLDELLRVAVRGLIDVSEADRAGVWVAGPELVADWHGHIEERSGDAVPPEWTRVNQALSFLSGIVKNGQPALQKFCKELGVETFGPIMDMGTALWLPLRLDGRLLGLALAAWKRTGHTPPILPLQCITEQLSVAVARLADATVAQARQSELVSRDQIKKAIMEGASADESLRMLLSHVKCYTGCLFSAVGVQREGAMCCLVVEGAADRPMPLHENPLKEAWTRSLAEKRAVPLDECPGNSVQMSLPLRATSPSIVAVALQPSLGNSFSDMPGLFGGRNESSFGVLVAGYIPGADVSENCARLETYASLASLALQIHCQRQWEKETKSAQASLLAKTSEWILFVDDLGVIRGGSKAALNKLGGGGFFAVQRNLDDLFNADTRTLVQAWRKAALSGTVEILEAGLTNGVIVQLRIRLAPFSTHAGRRWEISLEAKPQQKALSWSAGFAEREFETLLDSVESGVVLFDSGERVRMANDRFSQIFGMDLRQIRAIDSREQLAQRLSECSMDPEAFRARWKGIAQSGEAASCDEFLVLPTRRVIERHARPMFDADGAPSGWLEVWHEVTTARLQQAKLKQSEKMAAIGQLVSSVAHELNNPLTSIMGYAQLLFARTQGSELNADLAKIHDEAERASRIIKNLLLRAREPSIGREPVDLNDVVQRTLALRDDDLKLANIAVESDLDPKLPLVLADAGQMQQVILNLLVNAQQAIAQQVIASGKDRGQIRIRTRSVAANRVTLEVTDDGPGIPPGISAHIFDPFFTTKPAGIGTGLGLSIVTGIVQAHGGSIRLISASGPGASFRIELPRAASWRPGISQVASKTVPPEAVDRPENSKRAITGSSQAVSRKKHILVVEDEPTVAQLIADVLRADGHRVTVVLDSCTGLKLTQEQSFDLLICDLKMPGLDGRALYHRLEHSKSPLLQRIIFVTGDTLGPQTLEFLEAYSLPYLAKPFLVEELKDAVERVLRLPLQKAQAASSSAANNSSAVTTRKP